MWYYHTVIDNGNNLEIEYGACTSISVSVLCTCTFRSKASILFEILIYRYNDLLRNNNTVKRQEKQEK